MEGRCLWHTGEDTGFPGIGITSGCKLPFMGAKNSVLLQEHTPCLKFCTVSRKLKKIPGT